MSVPQLISILIFDDTGIWLGTTQRRVAFEDNHQLLKQTNLQYFSIAIIILERVVFTSFYIVFLFIPSSQMALKWLISCIEVFVCFPASAIEALFEI